MNDTITLQELQEHLQDLLDQGIEPDTQVRILSDDRHAWEYTAREVQDIFSECERCDGTGQLTEIHDCDKCEGTGKIKIVYIACGSQVRYAPSEVTDILGRY